MLDLAYRLAARLDAARPWAWAAIRACVGVLFLGSGWGKLRGLREFIAYFESLGIPAAGIQAPFVAGLELVGGLLLVAGAATRAMSAALTGVMLVAIATARLREASVGGLTDFLYLNEWLLVLLLVAFLFTGAGRLSVDALLARRLGRQGPVGD